MLKQSGNNLESEGTNGNEVGIGENAWESGVARGHKQGITEKDEGSSQKKGTYCKQARKS